MVYIDRNAFDEDLSLNKNALENDKFSPLTMGEGGCYVVLTEERTSM